MNDSKFERNEDPNDPGNYEAEEIKTPHDPLLTLIKSFTRDFRECKITSATSLTKIDSEISTVEYRIILDLKTRK